MIINIRTTDVGFNPNVNYILAQVLSQGLDYTILVCPITGLLDSVLTAKVKVHKW